MADLSLGNHTSEGPSRLIGLHVQTTTRGNSGRPRNNHQSKKFSSKEALPLRHQSLEAKSGYNLCLPDITTSSPGIEFPRSIRVFEPFKRYIDNSDKKGYSSQKVYAKNKPPTEKILKLENLTPDRNVGIKFKDELRKVEGIGDDGSKLFKKNFYEHFNHKKENAISSRIQESNTLSHFTTEKEQTEEEGVSDVEEHKVNSNLTCHKPDSSNSTEVNSASVKLQDCSEKRIDVVQKLRNTRKIRSSVKSKRKMDSKTAVLKEIDAENRTEFPPLVWKDLKTRAVLAKPVHRFLTPSERIGANLTAMRYCLRIPYRFPMGRSNYSILPIMELKSHKPNKMRSSSIVICKELLEKKMPLWKFCHQDKRVEKSKKSLEFKNIQISHKKMSKAAMKAVKDLKLEELLESKMKREKRMTETMSKTRKTKKIEHKDSRNIEFTNSRVVRREKPPDCNYWEASRASSPTEQMENQRKSRGLIQVAEKDFDDNSEDRRLEHYLRNGLPKDQITEPPENLLKIVSQDLDKRKLRDIRFRVVVSELFEELKDNFLKGIQRGVILYCLSCPEERKRLKLFHNLTPYTPLMVRAPVPWHQNIVTSRHYNTHNLFPVHYLLWKLDQLWNERFSFLRLVDTSHFHRKVISEAKHDSSEDEKPTAVSFDDQNNTTDFVEDDIIMPLTPEELEKLVKEQCNETRQLLLQRWLPAVARLFIDYLDSWKSLAPMQDGESLRQVRRFFACIRSRMSLQIRQMVMISLETFMNFFEVHRESNAYEGDYTDMKFHNTPALHLKAVTSSDGEVICSPSLEETRQTLQRCLKAIIDANSNLPRVEKLLFPEMSDQKMFLHSVSWTESDVVSSRKRLTDILSLNTPGPVTYLSNYLPFNGLTGGEMGRRVREFVEECGEIKVILEADERKAANSKRGAMIKTATSLLSTLSDYQEAVRKLRSDVNIGLVLLSCGEVNELLTSEVSSLQTSIYDYFIHWNREHSKEISRNFDKISTRLGQVSDQTAEVVELSNYLHECSSHTMVQLLQDINNTTARVFFLAEHGHFPSDQLPVVQRLYWWPVRIQEDIQLAETRLAHKRDQKEAALKTRVLAFQNILNQYNKELEDLKNRDNFSMKEIRVDTMRRNVELLDRLTVQLQEAKEEMQAINEEQSLLSWEATKFPLLHQLLTQKESFDSLWRTTYHFHTQHEIWYHGPFQTLDAEAIIEEVEMMWRTIFKLTKTFSDQIMSRRVSEYVKDRIEKFRRHLPVLQCICNPGLRERHWKQLSEVLGDPLELKEETSLADMIEAGLQTISKKLEEISHSASKEFSLEKSLIKMKEEWSGIEFEFKTWRDSGAMILAPVDDIQALLDEHTQKAQTMRGSPYVKPFETEIREWEEKLLSMQDILDAWIKCQVTWLYLEPIFASEDILKQMPVEGRKFTKVDSMWRSVMDVAVSDPHALQATAQPNMLENLSQCNVLLAEIQKGLNDYLEKKRLFFPRFFFLSNDELLEILSETKDPERVQPHLRKCFEGIKCLHFSPHQEVEGMKSAEGELVQFSNRVIPAKSRGLVERWLSEVESMMVQSLQDVTLRALESHAQLKHPEWIRKWPSQVVLTVAQIVWTAEVETAIQQGKLTEYLQVCSARIEEVVEMVRGQLDAGTRITLGALIVTYVHGRDVVEELIAKNVESRTSFSWISQLRFLWEDELVKVSMVYTTLQYGYEFLGNTSRLVMTPLTDRCFRTLMSALRLCLGGSPEGPAGTGKTETCKDLAKAVAKQCIIYNCSEALDYKAMAKFFKGLAQTGAWACFDEFNRIELSVLSVVGQQVSSIQSAVAKKVPTFMFDGVEIKLNPTCAMFITMNPSYQGRQELPDSVKQLFRTVAMMVPDYSMIAKILLFSVGFVNADSLSRKIVDTFRLCSTQLSPRPHYDYGMRAVKAVLTSAAVHKLHSPDVSEQILILRAIRDVNIPKFLSEDIPLFEGILKDLFPDECHKEEGESEERELTLKDSIVSTLRENNLQPVEWMVSKMLQLNSMIKVRHGIMIVGEPLSGKTTVYKILSETLNKLHREHRQKRLKEAAKAATLAGAIKKKQKTATLSKCSDESGSMENNISVSYKVINPKSLALPQLYGAYEPFAQEFRDGVLGKSFRDLATSPGRDLRWLVLDGPVDTLWVERLNAVLDDNKKLCLMSGEIIQMPENMTVILETGGLEQASPATVSRCGVVYMETKELGWEPLMESFLSTLTSELSDAIVDLVSKVLRWLLPPLMEYVTTKCKLILPTTKNGLFKTFTQLFPCLLDDIKALTKQLSEEKTSTHVQHMLVFIITWTIGASVIGSSRRHFDHFYRSLLYGKLDEHPKPDEFRITRGMMFSEHGLVYDFFYDKSTSRWINWIDTVPQERLSIPSGAKISNITISTADTARQEYFTKICVAKGVPVLILGPSGTGKTSVTLSYLKNLPEDTNTVNCVTLTARSTAGQLQDNIMSKVDRRRKGVFGPQMGKSYVMYVDDVHVPQDEEFGAKPPVELLRQWLDQKSFYDTKDCSKIEIVSYLMVASMTVTSPGCSPVNPRLTPHFYPVVMDSFSDSTLDRIFGAILQWHFSRHGDTTIQRMARPIVDASRNLYRRVVSTLLPTPSKNHYQFNLRDYARVISGIMLTPLVTLNSPDKLFRLWLHEIFRVYHDRLVDDADRAKLFEISRETGERAFRLKLANMLTHLLPTPSSPPSVEVINKIVFADFLYPDDENKPYDEVQETSQLKTVLEGYISDYNLVHKTPLTLVITEYLVQHLLRISRVLKQESGHMMLVGVTGCGRKSAVQLASFISGSELMQIDIFRNYSFVDWREDLKKVLMKAGAENKSTVFLLDDSQLRDSSFAEDVNLLLNTGDIPGIFSNEEKTVMAEKIKAAAKEEGRKLDELPAGALQSLFLDNLKRHLHIVISTSPISKEYSTLLSTFPSLATCTTVNWLPPWPPSTLQEIGTHLLTDCSLSNTLLSNAVTACGYFHAQALDMAERYYATLRRRVYVTPTTFLNLVQTFKTLLLQKKTDITDMRMRYVTGLQKLREAENLISELQEELKDLQPKLQETSANTEALMIKIEQDTVQVEKKKELVAADEAVANRQFADAQAIKDDCEKELAKAVPALSKATQSLNTLKQDDVRVVKAMKNPPFGVKLVMEAVCVMLDIKPIRTPNPDGSGGRLKDYWTPSQKLLGDMKFLPMLLTYDKDAIPEKIVSVVREKYYNHPDFDPKKIRSVSTACEGLCRWVRAMVVYDQVVKIVAPKKRALEAANQELALQNEKLEEKRRELREVTDKLQSLNDEFTKKQKEKKDLEDSIVRCQQKRGRSERLIGGLGGERGRWSASVSELSDQLENIVGDALLSAAVLVYLGPYTAEYREECMSNWHRKCKELDILCSPEFSLRNTLSNPVQVRSWHLTGLPLDSYSVDNVIIATKSNKWPLMIDPQGEASKFFKSLIGEESLILVQQTDPSFVTKLETALRDGKTLIIENVEESLDPIIDPVLQHQTFKQQGIDHVRLGDNVVEYSKDFRLYITTRLINPHYSPKITLKVTLINFMITQLGLENQLLGLVVGQEKPQLEQKRTNLLHESAANKKSLQDTQDQILHVLSTAGENLLEDEMAIDIMSCSRDLTESIASKEKIVAETEKDINITRDSYKSVASHAAVVFFSVTDLAVVDHMYQFSLEWFMNLYLKSILSSGQTSDTAERMSLINNSLTRSVFESVCSSLFDEHVSLFTLLLAMRLYRAKINSPLQDLLLFLLSNTGGGGKTALLSPTPPNPHRDWLPDNIWTNVLSAATCSSLVTLQSHINTSPDCWHEYYLSEYPYSAPLPEPYGNANLLVKMAIVKCLRPADVSVAVRAFVEQVLGASYLVAPPSSLQKAFDCSLASTPIILMLTPGAAPLPQIQRFAEEMLLPDDVLVSLSIGQGQESEAERLLHQCAENGSWLILQNCHLGGKWLSRLDMLAHKVAHMDTTHGSFRLWLTSASTPSFPVSLLQRGVKLSIQTPAGMRQSVTQSYLNTPYSDGTFYGTYDENLQKAKMFKNLLYSLALFHALVLERKNYGPIGWNVPYSFNETDLKISAMQIKVLFNECTADGSVEGFPLDALHYLAGECHYGGKVTDAKDRRLLSTILRTVCSLEEKDISPFIKTLLLPEDNEDWSHERYLEHIGTLPINVSPEIFGLHENSAAIRDVRDLNKLFSGVLELEPHLTTATIGATVDPQTSSSFLSDLVSELLVMLPQPPHVLELESMERREITNPLLEDTMSNVMKQEISRYSSLVRTIRSNLREVLRAVTGEIPVTVSLEETMKSLVLGTIPSQWMKCSYPTQKNLTGYIADLLKRLVFLDVWQREGFPSVFWFSGLFFPSSFLTGLRQYFARYLQVAIDTVSFRYKVVDDVTVDGWGDTESPTGGLLDLPTEGLRGTIVPPQTTDAESSVIEEMEWSEEEKKEEKESKKGESKNKKTEEANIRKEEMKQKKEDGKFKGAPIPAIEAPGPTSDHSVRIYGLYIEGATWNTVTGTLSDSVPHKLHHQLPVVEVSAVIGAEEENEEHDIYSCPVYQTSERKGQLTTTGHSTNYIFDLRLPTDAPVAHWVLRGTALITQLDN